MAGASASVVSHLVGLKQLWGGDCHLDIQEFGVRNR